MTNDDRLGYGTVTRWLHWGIATLLVWQLAGMILKNVLGRTPLMGFWVGSHASVGTLLLVLIVARAIWAYRHRNQRPPYQSGPVGTLARIGHIALYTLMLVVPTLAVLRMIGSNRPIKLFGVELRGPTEAPVEWMTAPANLLHGTLAWLLLALIVGHVAMALVHHFAWRDGTLGLMLGRRTGRRNAAPPAA